jgi:hypothetical protein
MSGLDPSAGPVETGTPGAYDGTARAFADAPNRLVGYLLDAVFLSLLSFVGAVAISVVFGPVVSIDVGAASQVTVDRGLAVANAVLGTAISLVYFVASWRSLGGSPGQRALRMRVGGANGPVTLARWTVRWAFLGAPIALEGIVSAVATGWVVMVTTLAVVLWFVLLLASIARSGSKQGWHDRAARTVVTKALLPAPAVDAAGTELEPRVH